MRTFSEWICKITGHWFSHVDQLIFQIKTNELNNDMTAQIKCKCCGKIFVHKHSHLASKDEDDPDVGKKLMKEKVKI